MRHDPADVRPAVAVVAHEVQAQEPPRGLRRRHRGDRLEGVQHRRGGSDVGHYVHDVAVQVAFERQTLKPGYRFDRKSLETRRFQAMLWVNCIQRVQPLCSAYILAAGIQSSLTHLSRK
jgi:hypothetical protein